MRIASAQLWVQDQDEALAFYTEKVGMEIKSDVTVPELGDFRWLTVGPPGQDEVAIVLMAIPGPPVFEAETVEQIKAVMAKGVAGTVFLTTEDCRAELRGAQGPRCRVRGGARGAPVRDRRRLPRSLGQPPAAHAGDHGGRVARARSPS